MCVNMFLYPVEDINLNTPQLMRTYKSYRIIFCLCVCVLAQAYGGFLSSVLLLSHGSELRCGAAMSPVFDWQLYGKCDTHTNSLTLTYSLSHTYHSSCNFFPLMRTTV